MTTDICIQPQLNTVAFRPDGKLLSSSWVTQIQINSNQLEGVATIDFHITTKCSQACPYCWGPRRFRTPVDTHIARRIIARIKSLGIQRIVFTGGDPLQRPDAPELIRFAKEMGLETALSTTGDFITPDLLKRLSPNLNLISLPLDGSSEEINARIKHPGHFSCSHAIAPLVTRFSTHRCEGLHTCHATQFKRYSCYRPAG